MFVFLIEDIFHKTLKNYVLCVSKWNLGGPEKGRFGSQFYNVARSFNEVQFEKLIQNKFSPSES